MEYVLGFLFDDFSSRVALIQKSKPDFLKGKWNGIGGKIEEGETPLEAMRREFNEEAGVDYDNWIPAITLQSYKGYTIHIFKGFSNTVLHVKTIEKEPVRIFYIQELKSPIHRPPLPHNLQWMIPLLLDFDISSGTLLDKGVF